MDVDLKTSPCPACGGIGMVHPPHPHAFGHYDYDRVRCRKRVKCGATFKTERYLRWLEQKKAPTERQT